MAGVADSAFRLMAKEGGASLVYSELVSAEGLIRDSSKTRDLMHFVSQERPIGVQLFGSKPESMAEAARQAETLQPDLIDLNFGCPVKKVIKHGAGAAVLQDLPRMKQIVHAVVQAVECPITAKIRIGWDHDSIVATEAARICEGEGAAAIAVHARTRSMGYSGKADWSYIRKVIQTVRIPVFGNGDVFSANDAKRMLDQTGCDLVMIGRGAMGRPWIFQQIQHFLDTGELIPDPSPSKRIEICLQHFDLAIQQKGENRAVKEMRKHFSAYIKGLRGASRLRTELFQMTEVDAIQEKLFIFAEDQSIHG